MIIAIKGGLGNQMFQYAHGRNLELGGKKIVFDTSFYAGNKAKIDTARNFKLNNFNIETNEMFSEKKHPCLNLITKVLIHLNLSDGGFWQSEKYFIENEGSIRKEFTLKSPLSLKAQEASINIKSSKNSVSFHVRRGDYVSDAKTNEHHGTCEPEYYAKALEYIASKIGKEITVFIFSDDIEWVKKNIVIPYPATYVSTPNIPDYEELILMSQCHYHIIANSSFSWWGAWLDPSNDKIVVAPKQWVRTGANATKDIVHSSWIRI
jgi:hypothetical protein